MSANATTRILLSGRLAAVDELGRTLRMLEYDVEMHPRIEDAIQAWSRGHCEAALLSISPSHGAHFSAIKAFRQQRPNAPILVVSSLTQPEARVAALAAGADDYVTEPFTIPELQARLSAIIRYRATWSPAEIRIGPLVMRAGDPGAWIGTARVDLTPSERALLEMFALASGNVVAKSAIAQRLGENGESVSNTALQVVVYRLRRRLLPFGLSIVTLRSIGYRLQLADVDPGSTGRSQEQQSPRAVSGGESRSRMFLLPKSRSRQSRCGGTRVCSNTRTTQSSFGKCRAEEFFIGIAPRSSSMGTAEASRWGRPPTSSSRLIWPAVSLTSKAALPSTVSGSAS